MGATCPPPIFKKHAFYSTKGELERDEDPQCVCKGRSLEKIIKNPNSFELKSYPPKIKHNQKHNGNNHKHPAHTKNAFMVIILFLFYRKYSLSVPLVVRFNIDRKKTCNFEKYINNTNFLKFYGAKKQ
jgi:hypothetical protein